MIKVKLFRITVFIVIFYYRKMSREAKRFVSTVDNLLKLACLSNIKGVVSYALLYSRLALSVDRSFVYLHSLSTHFSILTCFPAPATLSSIWLCLVLYFGSSLSPCTYSSKRWGPLFQFIMGVKGVGLPQITQWWSIPRQRAINRSLVYYLISTGVHILVWEEKWIHISVLELLIGRKTQ